MKLLSEFITDLQKELYQNGDAPVWVEDEECCCHSDLKLKRELVEKYPKWNILTGKYYATDLIIGAQL
jgi:hypothetical protein